jgi:hypothetical protein
VAKEYVANSYRPEVHLTRVRPRCPGYTIGIWDHADQEVTKVYAVRLAQLRSGPDARHYGADRADQAYPDDGVGAPPAKRFAARGFAATDQFR